MRDKTPIGAISHNENESLKVNRALPPNTTTKILQLVIVY